MKRFPNPWHKDDPVKLSPVLRRYSLDYPWDKVPKSVHTLLQKGRMAMKCPYCSVESIAGPWCPKCERMVTPDNWYEAKNVSPEGKRRRGRPSKAEMASVMRYCEVCEAVG